MLGGGGDYLFRDLPEAYIFLSKSNLLSVVANNAPEPLDSFVAK